MNHDSWSWMHITFLWQKYKRQLVLVLGFILYVTYLQVRYAVFHLGTGNVKEESEFRKTEFDVTVTIYLLLQGNVREKVLLRNQFCKEFPNTEF